VVTVEVVTEVVAVAKLLWAEVACGEPCHWTWLP
jgi:hypothetical protein